MFTSICDSKDYSDSDIKRERDKKNAAYIVSTSLVMSCTETLAQWLTALCTGQENSNADCPAALGMWAGYQVYCLACCRSAWPLPPALSSFFSSWLPPLFVCVCAHRGLGMKLARAGPRPSLLQRMRGMHGGRVNTAPFSHSNPCSSRQPPPLLTSVHMRRQERSDSLACSACSWMVSVSDKAVNKARGA